MRKFSGREKKNYKCGNIIYILDTLINSFHCLEYNNYTTQQPKLSISIDYSFQDTNGF